MELKYDFLFIHFSDHYKSLNILEKFNKFGIVGGPRLSGILQKKYFGKNKN